MYQRLVLEDGAHDPPPGRWQGLDNWLRKVDSRVPNRGSPVPEGHGAPGRPFTRSVYVKLPLTGNMEMGYSGLPHLPVPF